MRVLDKSRTVAPRGYNRWLVPPAALAVHLSIGQVYAFSVFKNPLLERFGTSHTSVAVIFSMAIVMLGLSAAFGGKWMERNGPRKAMALSAVCWVTGFLVAALGVSVGQLWIVYLGYGLIGGIGLGIGYISPVSTLIKWFPDRPGLATGLAIMGFGGGALVASPLTAKLLETYGATPVDAIVPTMLTLAAVYAVLMTCGAVTIRVPQPGWRPEGWTPPTTSTNKMQSHADVRVGNAVRTPQFYLLWIVLFTNVTAGIGILEQASPMIQDFFPSVTAATAAGFVGLLSLANMGGRFGWSTTSDKLGRKRTYVMYLGVGAGLYGLLAALGSSSVGLFVALTFVIVSFYGGGFATIPAYLKDLFGQLEVGAIHGRLLTAWSAAGVAGPLIVNGIADARSAQGVTGAELYLPSLVTMCCVLVVGFVANMLVRPVAARYHEPADAALVAPTPVAVGATSEES
ncbi:major facilitator superfamily MFS_1 [Cellulomonas flavigena DSM 20109]|uniref:Major facilitator superfamily MFS_1 n=1 Tax=Cellulomonas flavigena (strain ATCC 482 / DSM 20109 / BCRC 11376 / JCM 18109 / NBRC 3775 / NCIMB 8073 / NRS 134) TaxID=446466 RepID=D5UJQ5_CELFN|nr:OFA family MFS transporter [Cellulomonas flavigena]ADG75693.1 major facilitator superfamily MFS_1 [Cellulomonas flavigena DSM 20109]